jgi:hypothetical protein
MTTASVSSEKEKEKEAQIINNNNNNSADNGLESLITIAKEKGFEIEENKDYEAGPIDLVLNIDIHPALPKIKCGFVILRADEPPGYEDTQDMEFSLKKI